MQTARPVGDHRDRAAVSTRLESGRHDQITPRPLIRHFFQIDAAAQIAPQDKALTNWRLLIWRNKPTSPRLACMPKYFFHLAGQLPARDLLGHECANDKDAKDHGSFIAHRIGTEKPGMVREGNFISVTNEQGDEIFQAPLASTTV
jgi:hypothetical protein